MSPLFIPMMIPNMAAAQISLGLGTKGPLSTVCTACAASTNGIGDAFEIIRRGEAEAMFAGGSEAPVCNVGLTAFAAMRALSTRNDEPEKASRPFDRDRDGFVMGEGAGIMVLEELGHAEQRGATIYAELVGYGMSSDAFHLTLPDETGQTQARAMRMAIDEAGIDPAEIDYINAHGTSTPPGDIAETRVIKIALGEENARKVAISSTKSMIGHCLGGSGALEAIISVLTIDRGVIPPTINLTEPDPECDLDYVPQHGASGDRQRGRLQLLRLRRPQRDARLPALRLMTVTVEIARRGTGPQERRWVCPSCRARARPGRRQGEPVGLSRPAAFTSASAPASASPSLPTNAASSSTGATCARSTRSTSSTSSPIRSGCARLRAQAA